MSNLDTYLESLYDDLQAKISGTAMILQLARTPDNLTELAENGDYCIMLTVIYCTAFYVCFFIQSHFFLL